MEITIIFREEKICPLEIGGENPDEKPNLTFPILLRILSLRRSPWFGKSCQNFGIPGDGGYFWSTAAREIFYINVIGIARRVTFFIDTDG